VKDSLEQKTEEP